MKKLCATGAFLALFACVGFSADPPPMPKPEKEHEWLKAFVGEWEMEGECMMEPGKTFKSKGTESCKALGSFWITSEIKGETPFGPMTGAMTVGYDPARKKFIGTWVDSMNSHMWKYEGTVDSTGKILTLEADGPSMTNPAKTAKYRDVTEFKSADHRVMKSEMMGEDGKWVTMMTMDAKKKK